MAKYIPVDWRKKYNDRSSKVKSLEKRIREIISGREKWKAKYMDTKQERDELRKELNDIKKKLRSIIP